MKTFEEEKKEIVEILESELREIDQKWREKYIINGEYSGGQDATEDVLRHEAISKYNQRLRRLKEQYGI